MYKTVKTISGNQWFYTVLYSFIHFLSISYNFLHFITCIISIQEVINKLFSTLQFEKPLLTALAECFLKEN